MSIKIPKNLMYALAVVALLVVMMKFGGRLSPQTINQPTTSISPGSEVNRTSKAREIVVTAKQFEFSPNSIRVRLGENIRLRLTSTDVTHGFSLPEFGISETLSPGQTVTAEFQATQEGEFPFACSISCGVGHAGMRGSLIVE